MEINIDQNKLAAFYLELINSNLKRFYFINPDQSFSKPLSESLLINEQRYGYQACPCRLANGVRAEDLDIICPCDYRDADVAQYGACYCGLYVSKKIYNNHLNIEPIPERRPSKEERDQKLMTEENTPNNLGSLEYPIWRCEICGYICARDEAPDVCPICGASHDRFNQFLKKT
jgi:ferredoxin-thioredoxin reductase catalytic subunit